MDTLNFTIDGKSIKFSIPDSQHFQYGDEQVLSSEKTDLTYGQPWYDQGLCTIPFLNDAEFKNLRTGLEECVAEIIRKELGFKPETFLLDRYHEFVRSNEDHMKIVSRTRDLFPKDFNFDLDELVKKFEAFLGFSLTDKDPASGQPLHVIVRINRPNSNDFNPPHKDVYEVFDGDAELSSFINMWIPVCGVTNKSSLPMVPASHLLSEDRILRTRIGGLIAGNKYRVRLVKEWDGKNTLTRTDVKYGDVLCFSPYLVHGLAVNEEEHLTRVSLEFRLFKEA